MDMSARWYPPTESSGIRPLRQLKERTMYEVARSVRKWRQRVGQGIVSMVANASQGMGSTVANRVAQGLVWRPTRRSRYGVGDSERVAKVRRRWGPMRRSRHGTDGCQRVA